MPTVTVQNLGDVAILRCQGRIVVGVENTILWNAVLSQTNISTLILDLAQVDGIDAGGLGVLLGVVGCSGHGRHGICGFSPEYPGKFPGRIPLISRRVCRGGSASTRRLARPLPAARRVRLRGPDSRRHPDVLCVSGELGNTLRQ